MSLNIMVKMKNMAIELTDIIMQMVSSIGSQK